MCESEKPLTLNNGGQTLGTEQSQPQSLNQAWLLEFIQSLPASLDGDRAKSALLCPLTSMMFSNGSLSTRVIGSSSEVKAGMSS